MVSALSHRPGRALRTAVVLLAGASLAACATTTPKLTTAPAPKPSASTAKLKVGKPYQVGGIWYTPREQPDYDEVGVASWYGAAHQSRPTASGEPFDKEQVSAAHTTLPLQSLVEVTNLANGRTLQVRINDRGPFAGRRIIDLSQAAARGLGFERDGLAKVRVRYIGPASAGVQAQIAPAPSSSVLAVVRPAVKADGPLIFGSSNEVAGGYGLGEAERLLAH